MLQVSLLSPNVLYNVFSSHHHHQLPLTDAAFKRKIKNSMSISAKFHVGSKLQNMSSNASVLETRSPENPVADL